MKIFLSHSNHPEDAEIIRLLELGAILSGIYLYVAERDKQPGRHIGEKIKNNLNSSDEFLVLYTKHAIASGTVREEIGLASAEGRPANPVFFAEDHGDLSAIHKGSECIKLDRNSVVESVYEVFQYFRSKIAPQDTFESPPGEAEILLEKDQIKFRLSWDGESEPILKNPDKIKCMGFCSVHLIEMKKTLGRGMSILWGCSICNYQISNWQYKKFVDEAKSKFLLSLNQKPTTK